MASNNRKNMGKGDYKTRLYRIWANMKQRCTNPNNTHYSYYGGRGIGVCKEWLNSFRQFKEWALCNGYEDDLTLDRIDGNGSYTPKNCRWVTRKSQQNNVSSNRLVEIDGETHNVTEWATLTGISSNTLTKRLNSGIVGKMLISPVDRRYSRNGGK